MTIALLALLAAGASAGAADRSVDAARREIERRGGSVEIVPGIHAGETFFAVEWSDGDEGLEHLAALEPLRWLDLSRSSISDAALRHVEPLATLELLYLAETARHRRRAGPAGRPDGTARAVSARDRRVDRRSSTHVAPGAAPLVEPVVHQSR